ncbi:TRAP transporter small permease [Azoarcus sp. L1K30]|uniref:TRAP transporter small permease n=1 Tax=Azoarcus sp. L1K30 TaxID=2820277 RepID=UPI001B81CE14|nr:TRAP transporter small permease [Azoarcus sp. L1K30]MBR0567571.1 TRAP transporter small permease [Azoarcus sp. L1K30]
MHHPYIRFMDRLYVLCIWIAGFSILFMSLIIPWGVFARYVMGTGSHWPEPVSILFMVIFTFVGAAASYRAGGHIAVSMLTDTLSPELQRVCAKLVDLLMLAICLFVAGYGILLSYETMGQTVAELPWMPVGITYLPLPLGSAFTLLFVIERIVFGSQQDRDIVRYEEHAAEGDA